MPSRALNYIGHHAIAITALVCSILALAASSYAAFSLSRKLRRRGADSKSRD